MNTRRTDDGWFVADDGTEVLELADPINRPRVRYAVMKYCKDYGHPPSELTRKVIWAMFGEEAIDGFDEGVDLAYR